MRPARTPRWNMHSELDPQNPEVTEHLYQLADDAVQAQPTPLYGQQENTLAEAPTLLATPGLRSLHLDSGAHQVIEQAFKAFGVIPMLDNSVRDQRVRLDVDNVGFVTAMHALSLVTDTFYVPLDAHRVLVAKDTRENRLQFTRQEMETVYLSGLSSEQLHTSRKPGEKRLRDSAGGHQCDRRYPHLACPCQQS